MFRRVFLSLAAVALMGAELPKAASLCSTAHFIDFAGNTLEVYEPQYELLRSFYGEATPPRITVTYQEGSLSQFTPDHEGVRLGLAHVRSENAAFVLTHEASHDCLARLTNDASELEQFRFIDEGLALIMEKKAAGDLEGLRRDAKIAAAVQLRAGNLSLAKLQRWKSYFGDPRGPERPHAYAYPVGASFDLYVWDILGEPAFRRLLVEIGRDRDLDAALHSALRKNLAEVEAAWLATLSRVEPIPPQIVEMLPADGAGEVDPSLKELRVRFNMDMASEVCVVAPCKEGICSSNARWDGPRTLVIAIDRQLEARHSFGFALGDKRERCHFWSTTGLPLPVTSWSFQTR